MSERLTFSEKRYGNAFKITLTSKTQKNQNEPLKLAAIPLRLFVIDSTKRIHFKT